MVTALASGGPEDGEAERKAILERLGFGLFLMVFLWAQSSPPLDSHVHTHI